MSIISDLSAGATSGLFSGVGQLAKDIRVAITGIDPEKQAAIEEKLLEFEAASDDAQAKINAVEAASPKLFVSGWRPFVGWTCGAALAYQFLATPFLTWASLNFGWKTPPQLDLSTMMPILIGMLGLSTNRMFEKKWGVASK